MDIDEKPLSDFCRACLSSDHDLISIFESFHNDIALTQIIMNCVPVFIAENDGLSGKICVVCKIKAVDFNEFQQMFLSSEKKLRKVLESDELLDFPWKVKQEAEDPVDEISYDSNFNPNCVLIKEMIESEFTEEDVEESSSHKKTKHKSKPKKSFECNICFKKFSTCLKLSNHKTSAHTPNTSTNERSTVKQESFSAKSEKMDSDSQSQDNSSHHQCNDCPKIFDSEKTLQRHQIIHSDLMENSKYERDPSDWFHCVICPERIQEYKSLFVHMRKSHKNKEKEEGYECRLCSAENSKILKNMASVVRHAAIHEENATHKCSVCARKMGYGEALNVHLLRHQGEHENNCFNFYVKKTI